MEGLYEVVAPTGRRVRAAHLSAPPIGSLRGIRIAEIWDYLFRGDELFGLLREALRRRAAGIEIVPYPVIGRIHGPDEARLLAELPQVLARERVGAVISGVGA